MLWPTCKTRSTLDNTTDLPRVACSHVRVPWIFGTGIGAHKLINPPQVKVATDVFTSCEFCPLFRCAMPLVAGEQNFRKQLFTSDRIRRILILLIFLRGRVPSVFDPVPAQGI